MGPMSLHHTQSLLSALYVFIECSALHMSWINFIVTNNWFGHQFYVPLVQCMENVHAKKAFKDQSQSGLCYKFSSLQSHCPNGHWIMTSMKAATHTHIAHAYLDTNCRNDMYQIIQNVVEKKENIAAHIQSNERRRMRLHFAQHKC